MAIARIPGYSLESDLDRQGTNLQFSTTGNALVYMDFSNFYVGINTVTPSQALEVNGNLLISNGSVLTSANLTYDIGSIDNWFKNVYANNVAAGSFTSNTLVGTLLTNAQPNITSLGTLTELTVAGNINVTSGNLQPSANLTSSIGFVDNWWNTLYANTVTAAGYYGTILTGNQPNITNLGNITVDSVNISGNIEVDILRANEVYDNNNRVLTDVSTITVTGNDITGSGNVSNVYVVLSDTGVTAGVYGSADDEYADRIPKITVDSKGRITNIANVTLTQVGNVNFNNTTISSDSGITVSTLNNGNITLNANGTGIVQISGSNAIGIPYGNTATRPSATEVGYLRYNTDLQVVEYWNGSDWFNESPGIVSSYIITPNGVDDTYTLSGNATTNGILVTINGTLQQPATAYSVSDGDQITFTEVPASTDIIEIRSIASGVAALPQISYGTSKIEIISPNGGINFTAGANLAYSLTPTGAVVGTLTNLVVSTASVATNIDSYDKTVYRTAKYLLQATHDTDYESYDVIVTHNGTSAFKTVSSTVNTGTTLGNVTAIISGSNLVFQYTADNNDTFIRLTKTYLLV
jgi:hypothetical protein